MIIWVTTGLFVLIFARIIFLERKYGRRINTRLEQTNEITLSLIQNGMERYRAKFGKDPTGPYQTVDLPKTASKKV